jgi:hypothetical protein
MSAEVSGTPDVRLTVAAADEIKQMDPDEIGRVLGRVGRGEGEPVDLPGAPPGTQYLALRPESPKAPVVIYRPMLPNEDGDWLVTSLIPQDNFNAWRQSAAWLPQVARMRRPPGKD